jgi:hypothetical protein
MGRSTKYVVGIDKKRLARKERAEKKVQVVASEIKDSLKAAEKVEAAVASGEYSKEQIAQLISDFTKVDPYRLKGLNPSFRYRFLNRQADKLDRQTMRGWAIITGAEAEKLAQDNKTRTRQGQIIVGDGVLAKIPMDVYVAYMGKLKDLNKRMVDQSSNTLRRDMGSKYSRNVEESLKVREKGQREVVEI